MDATNQSQQLLARLDRLPVWPFPYWVIVIVGFGFFFGFFDIVTIGLALPVLVKQFHISIEFAIWGVTSSLIGYIIGSFLDSRLSDLFGRRLALLLSMTFFSIGSILSATSPNMIWLIIWRFFIGMGIGSEIANVTTYMGELSPASCRGRFTSIAIAWGFLGFAIVPFVGVLLIPNFSWGWRVLFACGGLGGIVVLFFRRFIPQSIRWYISKGRFQHAEELLQQAENLAAKRYKKSLPQPTLQPTTNKTMRFIDLLKPPYLYKVVFFAAIWFIYYLGNYAWLTLNTKLFLLEGFDLRNSLLLVALSSIGFIIGSLIAIILGDKLERKMTVSIAALIWTICLALIAWLPSLPIILIFGCIGAATISLLIPLLYTFTAENFPTPCRATGVSITDGIGHLGGAFCGQIILGIYFLFKATGFGAQAAFTSVAITGLLTTLLVLLGTKMTGKQLQQ